ncbi:MAG: succinyldiaminopimelate transaminase [Gammaproteobacteria bacterium]|nr:succinyldiaminopimelate transaminase [Gammaproteobacteria bacterium]MDH5802808.1 succinyldiaminopimelate transaminase [Gammaproteobacteria bacterium]
MNPDLNKLKSYPFEKLLQLKTGITPPEGLEPIALSIGEPKHEVPNFVAPELLKHLSSLGQYPLSKGTDELRQCISDWLTRRFHLNEGSVSPAEHVIPVNGTREALFAFAQAVVDRQQNPLVIMPNPFYQIYEGAALLAGAEPYYLNTVAETHFVPDFEQVPAQVWSRCQLLYLCSPGNPTGAVMDLPSLQKLIQLADEHDFIIASDECYSEIYFDETAPPPGLLQAAQAMGRTDFKRCVVFHSLSKRSNVPGLRSGFVAGDAAVLKKFLLYRTYHGCAVPLFIQATSIALWNDEEHVRQNRDIYRHKFDSVLKVLQPHLQVEHPQAGFYLWPQTPSDDETFAKELYRSQNITVLPGTYLSRDTSDGNPGKNRVRIALVATESQCLEAANRMVSFIQKGI